MKIVLPGGSGQVGTLLARAFQQDGHEVVVLSRKLYKAPWRVVVWDANPQPPHSGIKSAKRKPPRQLPRGFRVVRLFSLHRKKGQDFAMRNQVRT